MGKSLPSNAPQITLADGTRHAVWAEVDSLGPISPFVVYIFTDKNDGNGWVEDIEIYGWGDPETQLIPNVQAAPGIASLNAWLFNEANVKLATIPIAQPVPPPVGEPTTAAQAEAMIQAFLASKTLHVVGGVLKLV